VHTLPLIEDKSTGAGLILILIFPGSIKCDIYQI